jgi:hypothetical protein
MRPTIRQTPRAGVLLLAGLIAAAVAGNAGGSPRAALGKAGPERVLAERLGADSALVEHTTDALEAESNGHSLLVESWKYHTAEKITLDLVLVHDETGAPVQGLIDERDLSPNHDTITLTGGVSATVERTADEYGPGLIIITWAYDRDTAAHLIAHDPLDEATVIGLANSVEAGS